MAKRSSKKPTGPSMEQMTTFVRQEGVSYLRSPNINSVGIGLKHDTKLGQTKTVCIQFTVDRKALPEQLESLSTQMIPRVVSIGGHTVPTDVLERRYTPTYTVMAEKVATKPSRKLRMDTLQPGISISHPSGTAGTLGAIVYDRRTGQPMILSNWHVLQGPGARIGDSIVQPGPFDDNRIDTNRCGTLVRSHLGAAGDCAVATIEGRLFKTPILDLDVAPARVGRAELGDIVKKSGRTTGVTYGRISRIEVQSKLDYGGQEVTIGGFEISIDPKHRPADGEVSSGGDSGSAWLAVDKKSGRVTDVLLGLHFAGEGSGEKREYALACNAHSVLEKLEVSLAPVAAPIAGTTESVHKYGGPGYDEGFLPEIIPLPKPRQSILSDIVGANGTKIAHYTHYSLAMRKSRRLAAFVAWNIDGSNITKPSSKAASWGKDDRIPDDAQVDQIIYDGTVFDKGHLAKREDLLWGGKTVAKKANDDSFCYTNATPQHDHFNRLAPHLWKSLEDELFGQVDVQDFRVSVFAGPIFRDTDRKFRPKAASPSFKPLAIPKEFFKIVAYVDDADGELKVHAFKLSQADLIAGDLESIALEELDLSRFKMHQVSVASLEDVTRISFGNLGDFDTFSSGAGPEAISTGPQVASFDDIHRKRVRR